MDKSKVLIRTELRNKLKAKALREGRTLEWMLNDALTEYLAPKPFRAQTLSEQVATVHNIISEPVKGNGAMQQLLSDKQVNVKNHYTAKLAREWADEPHVEPVDE